MKMYRRGNKKHHPTKIGTIPKFLNKYAYFFVVIHLFLLRINLKFPYIKTKPYTNTISSRFLGFVDFMYG